ncbi:hypothetical protein LTR62_005171 [Meristemomyces frigidus]|uniref:Uncharacterized protein n=1 Tax=Meristemomyces frigidus TaxID=1508187 RepID=A0AAN7TEY3_9PEZI|nr:hypothetical protein LTR62_005171 [Meristemomyces frigidus]
MALPPSKTSDEKPTSRATPSVSSASSTSTRSSGPHRYLQSQQVSAIEYWQDHVQSPVRGEVDAAMEKEDAVVQAYLRAKMALFEVVPERMEMGAPVAG